MGIYIDMSDIIIGNNINIDDIIKGYFICKL